MRFAQPESLLWLVPWLGLALFVLLRERDRRARAAAFAQVPMLSRLVRGHDPRRVAVRLGLVLAGGALGLVALAGPRWGLRPERVETVGVDVVFAVDLSASMNARDLPPSRLEVARLELSDMIRRLEGNRLALVGFAGRAYAFSPLTTDTGATDLFLETLSPRTIPIPGTALGDALRAALDRFPPQGPGGFIVLLTDGEDHHSDPLEAARQAASRGVRVLAVGIGTPSGGRVPDPEGEGSLRDEEGREVVSRLGEETLQEIARITGGSYLRLSPGGEAARRVVQAVRGGQARTMDSRLENRLRERYQVFLALALGLILAGRAMAESPEESA